MNQVKRKKRKAHVEKGIVLPADAVSRYVRCRQFRYFME